MWIIIRTSIYLHLIIIELKISHVEIEVFISCKESSNFYNSQFIRIKDTNWIGLIFKRFEQTRLKTFFELICIGSDAELKIIRNSSDWFWLNSYPELSLAYTTNEKKCHLNSGSVFFKNNFQFPRKFIYCTITFF